MNFMAFTVTLRNDFVVMVNGAGVPITTNDPENAFTTPDITKAIRLSNQIDGAEVKSILYDVVDCIEEVTEVLEGI